MNWDNFNTAGELHQDVIIILYNDLLGDELIHKIFKYVNGSAFRTWEYPEHLKTLGKYYKIIDRRNNA
jgi:hypothetical protein